MTSTDTATWVSSETEEKERHFRGILGMHIKICKGISTRTGASPYLYIDCHAGRGHLEYQGRKFLGSPLIAQDLLTGEGIAHDTVHFEKDPAEAALLGEALWVPTSILDCPDPDSAPIHVTPCEDGLPVWLEEHGDQSGRHGLVYADPIGKEIPHRVLAQVARRLTRVDILCYVSATAYKRRGGPRLSDHIAAVGKKYTLVREPRGAWQWTFLLFTNWGGFPAWEKSGFHRADSERGAKILHQLDLTTRELRERTNTPLPLDAEPPYRTYREYLKHPRFLAVRAEVFERAAGACERCKLRPPTEPHHLRYPPWGTFDVPENLIAVCHRCHCEIHGKAA